MPKPPTGPSFYKRTFDISFYPIDYTDELPSGETVGSVSATATDATGAPANSVIAGSVIRTGAKIVDVIVTGGTAQTYTVTVDAVGASAPSVTRWQRRITFSLIVS